MTITVELPPEIEQRVLAQARVRSLSVDAIVQDFLARSAESPLPVDLTPEEWSKALDDSLDSLPATGPLPDNAFDRDNIYGREDNW